MNEKLKKLTDLIQKSETLKDKERNALLEELKAAVKEFEITAFKLERTEKVKKTTAILLEETIEELEQKRKAVESQNRELEIEAALERIRTHNMAMQDSSELAETSSVFFNEFKELGLLPAEARTYFSFIDSETDTASVWMTQADGTVRPGTHNVPLNGSPQLKKVYNAWKQKEPLIIRNMSGKVLDEYIRFVSTLPHVKKDDALKKLLSSTPKRIVMTEATFKYGTIGIMTNELLPEETQNTLIKFAKVFEQTYARFLDLKNAEARTREAQIEAALEKVRSSALAMKEPADMVDVCRIVSDQLELLGIKDIRNVQTVVIYEEKGTYLNYQYFTAYKKSAIEEADYKKHPAAYRMAQEMKKSGEAFYTESFSGEKLNVFREYRNSDNQFPDPIMDKTTSVHFYFFSIGMGALGISTYDKELSEKDVILFKQFRNVFELAYRRFVDIETALAQAREAKIEAALERVRSRTMGMQKSEELKEVIQLVYEQLVHLNIQTEHTGFILDYKTRDDLHIWLADEREIPSEITIPCFESPPNNSIREAKEKGRDFFKYLLTFEEKNKFYKELFKHIPGVPEESLEYYFSCPGLAGSGVLLENIGLYIENFSGIPYTDEENDTLMRFGKVFQQTYTRFLDLQKAESQAREAQIEAALERVRSRTMAMQQSNELAETAADFFLQLNNLGIKPYRCSIAIVNEQNDKCQLWSTTNEGKVIPIGTFIPVTENDVIIQMYEGWKVQQHRIIKITGEARIKWTEYIRKYVPFAEYMPENIDIEKLKSEAAILSNFYFKQGWFVIHTSEEVAESDLKILQRFANVFEQTYTRFLDLKKAEAQAKEAIKQASLDRVRAEIASMRTADDLNRITPIIWQELKALEVPFIRCGLYIIDEDNEKVQVYLTTPDGKALGVLNLSTDENEVTRNTVDHWRKKKVFKDFWDKQGFIKWTKSMIELGQVEDAVTYQGSADPPESLHLHFVPFNQGMLYVGDTSPLAEDKLQLVKTLAEAFSIAYARYEDFQNLEAAKNRIETTLSELKSTQAQLLHAEKMASLGELTAGIAHEIKNPLNFVNNFSEVSRELLDEMNIELKNNNIEEVIEMIEDLKQNLDKINHHGKRADLIIKSMLLHSRGSSGEKVLTNINELLDQYVVLAYHGMRAQNKEFNISIEKDYDESIPRINVVPQDISRVFLNIVNNACYAANDKKKKSGDNFNPLLNVSTKNLKDKIEIRIRDNGDGIPESVREQIFNPFFTSKPTGEGTGLGLSLSYDIVTKVHGGEIKFESEEGRFTEFRIVLPKK